MSSKFPSFSDLGKDCRNLFKRKDDSGLEIRSTATPDKTSSADVQLKATYPQWLTTVCKWDLENNVSLSHELNLTPRGKAALQGQFNPGTKNKKGLLNLQYQHSRLTLDGNVSGGDDSSVIVGASIVSGYRRIIAGYKVDYDTSARQLTSNNIALGYQTKDYGLLLTCDNLTALNGSCFYRVNRNLEVGVQSTMLGGEERTPFSVGGKFTFNGYGDSLKAVVNNKRVLGLELGLKLGTGFQVFVSSDIDLKTFSSGNNYVGFGLELGN